LQLVIEFLTRDDNSWSFDLTRYTCVEQIAKRLNLELESGKSNTPPAKILKEKIISTISGYGLNTSEFLTIKEHLTLEYYCSNKTLHHNALKFLFFVQYFIGNLNSYKTDEASWRLAKDYLEALMYLSNNLPNDEFWSHNGEQEIAASIRFLRSKGYSIHIETGKPALTPDSEAKFFAAINYRINKIGINGLLDTLEGISSCYRGNLDRYILRPEPTISPPPNVHTPWGYLFNLSLANLNTVKSTKQTKKLFLEIKELLEHFFCINKLQTWNKMSDLNHSHETILPGIQKTILFYQHFSIDQISGKHIETMVSGIFTSSYLEKFDVKVDIYLDILNCVANSSRNSSPLMFDLPSIVFNLRYKYSASDIENAINSLSFKVDEINKGYLYPAEIVKRNYYEKPFISVNNGYIYPSHVICSYGFYSTLLKMFNNLGANGKDIGDAIEDFVSRLFSDSGISFIANKKYKISSTIRSELSSKNKEGECDFIIETKDTIILIELKRKTLTSASRSGDMLQSAVDLSQSFFHALAQSGYHEYLLRRDGVINFDDGTCLELLGRNIERVSLSLFGFFGLQDTAFIQQIIKSLLNTQISSGNSKEDEKVNKHLRQLQAQFNSPVLSLEYRKYKKTFFNCRFISVPQLMEMLSHANNNEELLNQFKHTRQATTGGKDWFFDYEYMRSLGSLEK